MSQQGPNAVNLRWEAAQMRKKRREQDARPGGEAMSHHIAYCETHDVSFPEGEYCPVSEETGESCEFSAEPEKVTP